MDGKNYAGEDYCRRLFLLHAFRRGNVSIDRRRAWRDDCTMARSAGPRPDRTRARVLRWSHVRPRMKTDLANRGDSGASASWPWKRASLPIFLPLFPGASRSTVSWI